MVARYPIHRAGVTKRDKMGYEKLVAFYDRAEKAQQAARALESSGFLSNDISVLNGESLTDKDTRDGSAWQRLFGRAVSEQEGTGYRRTLDSGGAVLTLRTPDTEVNRAMKILDVHGPMNLRDRASAQTSASSSATSSRSEAGTRRTDLGQGEQVLRLAEERLDISKRQVTTGKSRIRRFVTEEPVQQQVTLHEEHCEIARREINDPQPANDVDWKDQTIEVAETNEEPVVTKTARIAEEIVIRRRGSDHVETIRDKVRRQQIDVQRVADVEGVPGLKKAA